MSNRRRDQHVGLHGLDRDELVMFWERVFRARDMPAQEMVSAAWHRVADSPAEMLEIFDEVATDLTRQEFPEFEKVCHSNVVHTRIVELPICDPIRDIRQRHLNALIKVAGQASPAPLALLPPPIKSVTPQLSLRNNHRPATRF